MYKKTILLVDDEPNTRRGITKTLESWSEGRFSILSAENGREALDYAKQYRIHLLVTDISMPEMDGLELLRSLKAEQQSLVAVVLSAYSEFDYAQEALRLGVVNYLLKPASKRMLIEAVEEALQIEEERTKVKTITRIADARLMDVQEKPLAAGPVKQAMHYIDQHIEHPLSLKEVAEHVHLNPNYFSMLFKEQANMTFSEYVTRARLQEAKSLLIKTNLSIEEVAERVGYSTSKYFIKIFKEFEGITPSKYKKVK